MIRTITLPPGYRRADLLAFHGRDAEGVAERVESNRIRKGVILDGVAVLLDIRLDQHSASCRIDADGVLTAAAQQLADDALLNTLGLRIDPAPFLEAVADDPLLGPVAAANSGLRIMQSATIFEALTWAIMGQQINLPFAISLRRTFIERAGRAHSSGMLCYPEAAGAAQLALEELTSRKFSRAKAETLLRLAQMVDSGALTLSRDTPVDEASAALLAIKGIGPWTVNYTLLRGYGYPDCSLHGDVAIRSAFQRLLGEDSKPDVARTEALLARYTPHRTMAAAHLWASLQSAA
ncbi:DNA-3-methyladenine glycosylase 2 [Massilia sp. PAMC28688]|uniref:DNA-3-methyladenine glycosylase family protein n=1 Tax=Massilia sp. PAMC28688 TaxID=2861283 RepID=UPI001C6358F0|nr:DNA-3-methyladenine glycosylase 2 [Massilia sp. PAMC28688]QYF91940.1 DNA-3-methyladenine glycosylase 2 [Massilia sp. PAMC28688]